MHRLTRADRRQLWLLIALTSLVELPPSVLVGWAWYAGGLGWGIVATVVLVPVMVAVLMTGTYLVSEFRREQLEREGV
ncbi:MAG TPA: hypothetical protein VH482_15895 [Thermomicrobiales bacterium]|jgi:uncharacterized membrane protein